jgi:hypothetical protein
VRAEQTVSEMVVESLARQAEALSEGNSKTFADAYAEVLETPARRQLGELANGPHRHEKAAEWQTGLLTDREARRPARLRTSEGGHEGGHEVGEDSLSWLGRYMDRVEGTDGREEYHSFLRNRFASLEG